MTNHNYDFLPELKFTELYRSLEVTPANPEMISSRDLSASNTEATVRSEIKFNSSIVRQVTKE